MFANRRQFRARKSLGYLNPPINFVLRFFQTVAAFLRGEPRLLIHNPNYLNPPMYLGACLALLVAFLKSAWPEDPIATFEIPQYLNLLKPFLKLLPLPIISIAILYAIAINIPMYIVSKLLRYRVRISRIIAATSYSFGTSLLLIAIFFVARPISFEILIGEDLKSLHYARSVWKWCAFAIMVLCILRSSKLLGISHGMSGYHFFFLNSLVIGLPLITLEFATEPTSKYRVISEILEPRPVQAFYIPGNSMSPSLPIGTELIVNRLFPRSQIVAGDVVVFYLPRDPTQTYIKRVVGSGGDEIQFINGILHINGTPVERTEIEDDLSITGHKYRTAESRFMEMLPNGARYEIIEKAEVHIDVNSQIFVVPDDHYFVLGDNRRSSLDSRNNFFGFIPVQNVVGKAYFVIYPMDRGPIALQR